MKWSPIIIMRATQKKRMSKAGHQHVGGVEEASSGVWSGQPMVEKGHRAEENQVSRTSVSWARSPPPQLAQALGSSLATVTWPHPAQDQAGMRWPHQICREMHQSRMLFIQSI